MDGFQLLNIITACVFLSSTLRNNQFIEYLIHRPFDSITGFLNKLNGNEDDFNTKDATEENYVIDDIPDADANNMDVKTDTEEASEEPAEEASDEPDEECEDKPATNNLITDLMVKVFFLYTNSLHQTYKLCDSVYRYHPASKLAIDIFYYAAKCISGYYMDYRVEPFSKNWVSVLVHTRHMFSEIDNIYYPDRPLRSTQLNEYIQSVHDTNNTLLQLAVFAKSIRDITPIMQTANKTPNYIDALLFCYYDNHYISKVIKTKTPSYQFDVDTNAPRSRVSFLSIKYIHPAQTTHIPIDLPRSMFYTGNEILSSAFIKRYLEYNHTDYIMNEEYTIEIMDNMLQTFELDKTQYILLKERNYTVITI